MSLSLHISLYWLLLPVALLLLALVAWLLRGIGPGPGDTIYCFFILGLAFLVFVVAVVALLLLDLCGR